MTESARQCSVSNAYQDFAIHNFRSTVTTVLKLTKTDLQIDNNESPVQTLLRDFANFVMTNLQRNYHWTI